MKLRELLNQMVDETWVKIALTGRRSVRLFMADYIGWEPSVMEPIEPYLDRDISSVEAIEDTDPESGEKCAMTYIELESRRDSRRCSDAELLEQLVVSVAYYDIAVMNFRHSVEDKLPKERRKELKRLMDTMKERRSKISSLLVEAKSSKDYALLSW